MRAEARRGVVDLFEVKIGKLRGFFRVRQRMLASGCLTNAMATAQKRETGKYEERNRKHEKENERAERGHNNM